MYRTGTTMQKLWIPNPSIVVVPRRLFFAAQQKIAVKRSAVHITLEKSSKNYISLFQEAKPSRHPRHPPHLFASCVGGFSTWWTAMCRLQARFSLAEFTREMRGGRAGWSVKQCHSITDHRIDCKFNMKIANSILLLCYLDRICLTLTGDLRRALASFYSEARL